MVTSGIQPGNIENIIGAYIKKGEKYIISGELELRGKKYWEVTFSKKKYLGAFSEVTGHLYIDEQYNVVASNKNFILELVKLAHFYEVFFSEDKRLGIQGITEIKGAVFEKEDFSGIAKVLEEFETAGIAGAAEVKAVILKLPDWNESISQKGKELNAVIKEFKSDNQSFSEEILKGFYSLYEDILVMNFQKIKDIGIIAPFCDDIKSASDKKRKSYSVRFNKNLVDKYSNLSYEISYFRRIIRTYAAVLKFNVNEYVKYLNEVNNEKIKDRISLIRS